MPTQGFNIKSLQKDGFKLNVWDVGGTFLAPFAVLSACTKSLLAQVRRPSALTGATITTTPMPW